MLGFDAEKLSAAIDIAELLNDFLLGKVMHLYLENFQSIRGPVRIDFAPITLFYGPNSAGKSAIYDAIRILSEMYENKWSDENMTPFMHQHNFDQKMTLGIGGIASFPGYYQPPMGKKKSAESDIGDFLLSINLPSFRQFVFSWIIDGGENSKNQYRGELEVRFLFKFYKDRSDMAGAFSSALSEIHIMASGYHFLSLNMERSTITLYTKNPLMEEINSQLLQDGVEIKNLCLSAIKSENLILGDGYIIISGGEFDCSEDLIIDEHIWNYFADTPYKNISSTAFQQLEVLLQYLIFSPLHSRAIFSKIQHIGPLRVIPKISDLQFFIYARGFWWDKNGVQKYTIDSYFSAPLEEKETSWEDGSEAWTALIEMDANCNKTNEIKEINDWLSSPELLGMDFSIEITTRDICDTSIVDESSKLFRRGLLTKAERAVKIAVIRLNNLKLGVFVPVHDVGVGLAQIIPILVSGIGKGYRNFSEPTFVEQPELHLHPKLQMQIADFFANTKNAKNKKWIIETHSEHIALRLLRRLRETTRNKLENQDFAVNPDDLAFYYFDPGDTATEVTRLRVTPAGEFLDRWPKGFFAEREGELFDDID